VGAAQIGWHKDESGKIDGYIKELGQTKVDRLQIGERKVHRCRSDCTGELAGIQNSYSHCRLPVAYHLGGQGTDVRMYGYGTTPYD
jgi:hypothetical protein